MQRSMFKQIGGNTILIAWLMLVTPCSVPAEDKVYQISGGIAVSGTIEAITPENITLRTRTGTQNFDVHEIQRIVLDGEPTAMINAVELTSEGQWEDAANELNKITRNSLKGEGLLSEYDFYFAYIRAQQALAGKQLAKPAAGQLHEFKTKNPKSYHTYQMAETLGDLSVLIPEFDLAQKFYGELDKATFPEYRQRGKYLSGKAYLKQNNPAEARQSFIAAVGINPEGSALPRMKHLQLLARVGMARCDIADNKVDAALKSLHSMIKEGDAADAELFAAIYNACGEAYIKQGKNELAVLAYLHTDLLFSTQPETHAEALYFLSQLFGKINEPLKASDAKAKLNSSYAGSTWANSK